MGSKKTEITNVEFKINNDNYASVEYLNGQPHDIFIKIDGGTLIVDVDKLVVLNSLLADIGLELRKHE